MKGYKINIEKETLENDNFRKVLYTGHYLQLVLMSLKPGEDIGGEVHENNDQFFRFESGTGKCTIDSTEYGITEGDIIVVPAGATHNIINTGVKLPLKMYTLYGPPNHMDGIIRGTKKEAEDDPESFDGVATEITYTDI
jgi:mannose-6-phosphate isomerase-like protein (cupin superfamily)